MADASHASGLSALGRHFLGGQLHAASELAWCAAPTVNSYRRYVPGSWAPTAAVWGEDNRTCGFRLVGRGAGRRIESRIPGADVNPYLVLAAAIAAGLYGIDHEIDPGDPYPRNAYEATDVPRIPSTLVEAIDALRGSEVAARPSGPTCTTTFSTRPNRSGPPPIVTSRTGSSPATSNGSDPATLAGPRERTGRR